MAPTMFYCPGPYNDSISSSTLKLSIFNIFTKIEDQILEIKIVQVTMQ